MNNENPFLRILDSNSDDELFEIIENPTKTNNPLLYDAAVSIALKRELITEFQAKSLIEGDLSVLQYNPDILAEQENSYTIEEKEPNKKPFQLEQNGIKFGFYLIGIGALLFVYSYYRSTVHYNNFSYFPISRMIIGGICFLIGIGVLVIGIAKKLKDK